MVLEKVERDPPILVNSHYFTIEQRIGSRSQARAICGNHLAQT